jgi:hypothetical protein
MADDEIQPTNVARPAHRADAFASRQLRKIYERDRRRQEKSRARHLVQFGRMQWPDILAAIFCLGMAVLIFGVSPGIAKLLVLLPALCLIASLYYMLARKPLRMSDNPMPALSALQGAHVGKAEPREEPGPSV